MAKEKYTLSESEKIDMTEDYNPPLEYDAHPEADAPPSVCRTYSVSLTAPGFADNLPPTGVYRTFSVCPPAAKLGDGDGLPPVGVCRTFSLSLPAPASEFAAIVSEDQVYQTHSGVEIAARAPVAASGGSVAEEDSSETIATGTSESLPSPASSFCGDEEERIDPKMLRIVVPKPDDISPAYKALYILSGCPDTEDYQQDLTGPLADAEVDLSNLGEESGLDIV